MGGRQADVCACGLVDTRTGRVSCRPVYEVGRTTRHAGREISSQASRHCSTGRRIGTCPDPPIRARHIISPLQGSPRRIFPSGRTASSAPDQIQVRPLRSPADNTTGHFPSPPSIHDPNHRPDRTSPHRDRPIAPQLDVQAHPQSWQPWQGGKPRSVTKVYAKKNAMGRTQKPGNFHRRWRLCMCRPRADPTTFGRRCQASTLSPSRPRGLCGDRKMMQRCGISKGMGRF